MHLHVVAFNIPYPPDYGGAIDVYYKLEALNKLGVDISLHTYEYNRKQSEKLESICRQVYYYKRKLRIVKLLSPLPFIVATRKSQELIDNLNRDSYPVLFEGIHTTYPLHANKLRKDKKTVVRTHNVEYRYYRGLSLSEPNPGKRFFFWLESVKLKCYERIVSRADGVAAISEGDVNYFSRVNPRTELITPFHPFQLVSLNEGRGEYIALHGDLSVPENIQSALWILDNVIGQISIPVKIAGKNPHQTIQKRIAQHTHVELICNPSDEELRKLIANAHINLIYSLYPQGFKLKLLNALYNGRFCLCNRQSVEGTGLEEACEIADSAKCFIEAINRLSQTDFDRQRAGQRAEILKKYNGGVVASKLLALF